MLPDGFSRTAIVIVMAVLAGCATLSKEECRRGDWHAIGQADGAAGLSMNQIDKHTRACKKAGVVPNLGAYTAGRQAGLVQFCTYESGAVEGAGNRTYNRVCTGPGEANFLRGYDIGQEYYAIGLRIDEIESNIDDTRELLRADNLDDGARYRLENILQGLENQRADLRVEAALILEKANISRRQ